MILGSDNWWIPVIIAVLILSMQATDAQDLSSVISGLKNLPAPDWVQEGTRMSYYSATADLPSANEKFILDEEGKRGTRSEYLLVRNTGVKSYLALQVMV